MICLPRNLVADRHDARPRDAVLRWMVRVVLPLLLESSTPAGSGSALQNWVFARQHGGDFVLRIEDTDASRNRPEWVDGILNALDWIGDRALAPTRGHCSSPPMPRLTRPPAPSSTPPGRRTTATALAMDVALRPHRASKRAGTTDSAAIAAWDPATSEHCVSALPTRGDRRGRPVRGTPTFDNRNLEDFVDRPGRRLGGLFCSPTWSMTSP